MATMQPSLYIDLSKAVWREELHPRDALGRFTRVRAGSRVVTKTGKSGVVQEVGDKHYKIKYDDGKIGKVTKENVLHEKDHKKVIELQKKAEKKKAAAKKAKETKAKNKANATGKTGAAKHIIDPTKGKKVLTNLEKKRAEKAAKKAAEKEAKKQAKELLRREIPKKETQTKSPSVEEQNRALAERQTMEETLPKSENVKLTEQWQRPEVQKILATPVNKRKAEQIQKVAGELTQANDNLARYVASTMARSMGIPLSANVIERHSGTIGRDEDRYARQETGLYGDMLQSARATMFETLSAVLSGSQKPGDGIAITTHVVNRMKNKLRRDLHSILNAIPAPHEIRGAIGDMHKAENELAQKLGRTPTTEELAQHLQKTSKAFKEAPIVPLPKWDDEKKTWVAEKKRISDPVERLRTLQVYAAQQRTVSADKNVGKEGEREVPLEEALSDRTQATPEQLYEAKERQRELSELIPKALKEMGLDENELKVMTTMYSQPSETGSKPQLTAAETAERINAAGGIGGKKIDHKWVANRLAAAFRKIQRAREQNHPAIQELMKYLHKSLVFNLILKSMYEFELVKSLSAWGVDLSVLTEQRTRTVYAANKVELRKSLMPYEYVGSYVVLEDGEIIANIVELVLPETNELYKSFNEFNKELRKSMFPHLDSKRRNHVINQKASEHVKKNSGKYKALSNSQQDRVRQKRASGKPLTWSEELLLKNPGSCWITWGGKKILIHGSTGEIIYDSANEAHREEYNQGAQEDKIEFHHEKEALEEHEAAREKAIREEWKNKVAEEEAKASKGRKPKEVDYEKLRQDFMKKHRGVSFDEQGNLVFQADTEIGEHNVHAVDHGIAAFREQMTEMGEQWKQLRRDMQESTKHRYVRLYSKMDEKEREAFDKMSHEERVKHVGEDILNQPGVKERLQKFYEDYNAAKTDQEKLDVARQAFEDLAALDKKELGEYSMALRNQRAMLGQGFKNGNLGGILGHVAKNGLEGVAEEIGSAEISRGGEEASKSHIPEGKFLIGNPLTGKTMVIQIGHGFEGGRAGKGNKFAPKLLEAFDPDGGTHEDAEMSWGQLGKLLGYSGEQAQRLKEILISSANKDASTPFLKPISDEEYNKYRANTKLGLQETMLHTDFKLVDEQRDKDGNLISRTYAQKMPDGTINHLTFDKDGFITDPLMMRLLKQKEPVRNEEDVNKLLKNAVGNRVWVTAHFGSDIHIGDALGHHIQLEYDGKGAPRVVGGKYDGYRYIDAKDVPKGAIDPATGEPVKALFKNGKLIDRRFTTVNEVPIKEGNPVMYPVGDGKYRKGRIHSIEGDNVKVTDGKGHVIGMFKKSELKPAKKEGRTLSESGQAVVRLAETGIHRMNTEEVFKGDDAKTRKAKVLFEQALKKAKINRDAFDSEGNLHKEIELSDSAMNRLKKVLGRSKTGRELLKQFNSTYKKELEIHVPENLRQAVEHTGVRLNADGRAKISAAKFEELREALGGLSLDYKAQQHLADHFRRKDRQPKNIAELRKQYQPSTIDSGNPEFDKHYKAQFKESSYLMNPAQGLYKTQLEGASHLVERGRAIAGHGMGTGKTILGVVAALHYKAQKLANGEKPKKTLIVAPKGILSDWGKEIGTHTNTKALYIGSGLTKRDADGKLMKAENGRRLWGQDGTEQEAVHFTHFRNNAEKIGSEDHDFHIVSYDTFMRNRDFFANSGLYDNIVIDEVHAFKNQKSKRGQSLAETTSKFQNVWGLSGTPMENDARELWSLIDTITGGKHDLGSRKEFTERYMKKDKNGKIVGVKAEMAEELGDKLANIVQFRSGTDVEYNDGSKIQFPHLVGVEGTPDNPNPQVDFIGDLVDRSRDHKTTEWYGTKHSVTDFEEVEKEVTNPKNGEKYTVKTYQPKNLDPATKAMYEKYKELQEKYLPESKLRELATAAATGIDQGQKGKENYLTAMQRLQKFLNAPLSHKIYVPGGGSALDAEETDAQSETPTKDGKKKSEPIPYVIDENGHKRYYESDGKGGYLTNPDGSPRLLPPLHHNNPKADYLRKRIEQYLTTLQAENRRRVARGEKPLVPKVVVKSNYTTFGTDVIDGVLRDIRRTHPIFRDLEEQGFKGLTEGSFTGDNPDRENIKVGFRGNKHDYLNNQGNVWATTVSPAGKEGVDFGNAHFMLHYDQDWNPQKMAQFTARVRRSDSVKTHQAVGRANAVRVESLHMPGTIEDFLFNAQDAKMEAIQTIVHGTKVAEKAPKLGETESKVGYSYRGFTSGGKKRVGRKPKDLKTGERPSEVDIKVAAAGGAAPRGAAAQAEKALKLVILL